MYAVFVIRRSGDSELRCHAKREAFLNALGLPATTETWWAVARLYGAILEIKSPAEAEEVLEIIRRRYPAHLAKAEVQIRVWLDEEEHFGDRGTIRGESGAVTSRAP